MLQFDLRIRGKVKNMTHLQNSAIVEVSIQAIYGIFSLLEVGHGDKAKTLALLLLAVSDDVHFLDGAEGTEQLP